MGLVDRWYTALGQVSVTKCSPSACLSEGHMACCEVKPPMICQPATTDAIVKVGQYRQVVPHSETAQPIKLIPT